MEHARYGRELKSVVASGSRTIEGQPRIKGEIMAEVLRRSGEWVLLTGIVIMDPDGWDRRDFQQSWNEPITHAEFMSRAMRSTIDFTSTEEEEQQ